MLHSTGDASKRISILVRICACLSLAIFLSACASAGTKQYPLAEGPRLLPSSKISTRLQTLPPPKEMVNVAVYAYQDQTGQNEPSERFARFSRAVTQGGASVLIDVLAGTGAGKWFRVVERSGVNNLLNERKLIEITRKNYLKKPSNLPPLRFAGIILEGGIVDYDANETTGGLGARSLGIGGNTQYRRHVVTVALRAVSVGTGEVLASVSTTKTLYSTLLNGSVFKFVSINRLLEVEAGITQNEPSSLAVRQAIELAVLNLIVEGAEKGLWQFSNQAAQAEQIEDFKKAYAPKTVSHNAGT